MKTTARFELDRQRHLKTVFTKEALVRCWRDLVKNQLRKQQILDLHDYYDFNVNIEARAANIIERILGGQYRAEVPVIYKLEKRLGICRHMLIPSPSDALVFQVLTDLIYEKVIAAQPSPQAYYARDRHALALPHEFAEKQSYPWQILWPKFQQEIWDFTKSCRYLVTTDLTNYYDNIGFEELRRVISATAPSAEVFLDLMFLLIQDLAWTPDYLPRTPRGLPVIEIEAPRLLAHCFLFEVDQVLKERTNSNFVRWMDDINFGVASVDEAKRTLGEVSDVLKSRGLALNLGKTEIMDVRQVKRHFMIDENKHLGRLQKKAQRLKTDLAKDRLAAQLVKQFRRHLKTCQARNKGKVSKRYFTILGKLKSARAVGIAGQLFCEAPELRSPILRYLASLPSTAKTRNALVFVLKKAPVYDDVTRLAVTRAIVEHQVPTTKSGTSFVAQVRKELSRPRNNFDWYARILFHSKYGAPSDILNFSEALKNVVKTDSFLARQLTSALAAAAKLNWAVVEKYWAQEVSRGSSDSASVAVNMLEIAKKGFPPKNHRTYFYLFPKSVRGGYPIAKYLLLCNLAAAELRVGTGKPRPEVTRVVSDPWMLASIKSINPTWF